MINIKARGINSVIRILDDVNDEVSDHRSFFRQEAVPAVRREVRKIFNTRGYGRWTPLSRLTILRKGHDRQLIDTRRYFRDATQTPRLTISRSRLVYGVDTPYADYHEEGTRYIPARPVFFLLAQNVQFQRRLVRRRERRIAERTR